MLPRMLPPILALALVTVALGTAFAAPPQSVAEKRAMHAEMAEARSAALASFHENRTRILDAYQTALHAIKQSFLENKTLMLEACKDARNASRNAYGYDNHGASAEAKCVHDGMKNLTRSARENMSEVRQEAHTALTAARGAALSSFANAKAAAHAKYGKPSE